jgi:hypothetical protein
VTLGEPLIHGTDKWHMFQSPCTRTRRAPHLQRVELQRWSEAGVDKPLIENPKSARHCEFSLKGSSSICVLFECAEG